MTVSHEQDDFDVESENLAAGHVIGVVVAIAAVVLMVITLAVNISGLEFEDGRKKAIGYTGYPLLESTTSAAATKLSQSGPVDGEDGVFQVPIENAMQLVVKDASSN